MLEINHESKLSHIIRIALKICSWGFYAERIILLPFFAGMVTMAFSLAPHGLELLLSGGGRRGRSCECDRVTVASTQSDLTWHEGARVASSCIALPSLWVGRNRNAATLVLLSPSN